MDGSQTNTEIAFLQSNVSNLESLNASLEKAKSLLEVRYKKLLKEKEEISERLEDFHEETEGLKQIRGQQEGQISELLKTQQKLLQELEQEQKSSTEYKNKLATVLVTSNAIKREMRSMTPPPMRMQEESNSPIVEDRESFPSRHCRTVESEISPYFPWDLEKTLEELEKLITAEVPQILIKWCQKVLGSENYILRYPETESIASEDSKSVVDNASVISEPSGQEISYRVHSKLAQQKKTIDNLLEKLKEKKQRIKISNDHIKTLQNEIRKLDEKLKLANSFDLEYLKTAVLKFAGKLRGLDKDSLTMLQVIFFQLGLKNEDLPTGEGKKKWGFFKSKEKK